MRSHGLSSRSGLSSSRSSSPSRSTRGHGFSKNSSLVSNKRLSNKSSSRISSQRTNSGRARSQARSRTSLSQRDRSGRASTARRSDRRTQGKVTAGAAAVSAVGVSRHVASGGVSSRMAGHHTYTRGVAVGVAAGVHGASFGVSLGYHTPAVYLDPVLHSHYWGSRYIFGGFSCGPSWRFWYYPLYGYWYHPSWHWWYYPSFGCWYYPDVSYWYYPWIGYSLTYTQGPRRYVLVENEQDQELYFGIYYQNEDSLFVRTALGSVDEQDSSKLLVPRRGEARRMVVFSRDKALLQEVLTEESSDGLSKVVIENDDLESEESDLSAAITIDNLDQDDQDYLNSVRQKVGQRAASEEGDLVDLREQKSKMRTLSDELKGVNPENSALKLATEEA